MQDDTAASVFEVDILVRVKVWFQVRNLTASQKQNVTPSSAIYSKTEMS